jgi:hypothetical protein
MHIIKRLFNKFKKRALKDARSLYTPKSKKVNDELYINTMDDLLNAIFKTRHEVLKRNLYDIYYLMTVNNNLTKPENLAIKFWNELPERKKIYKYIDESSGSKKPKYTGKTFKATVEDTGVLASFFGQFGDFNVPQSIIEGIIDARKKDLIHDVTIDTIPKSLYEGAKEVFELMKKNTCINEYALYGVIGALFVECAWNFDGIIYNKDEYAGNGIEGTKGFAGCGECWFGITYWKTKIKIINAINAPSNIPRTPEGYEAGGPNNILASLNKDWQCKITDAFLKDCAPKQYKVLSEKIKDIGNLDDDKMEEQLSASYLFKAGPAMDPTLENACEISERYMRTHTKQGHRNVKHGFYTQIFVAIAFALYLDENKVYKAKEIDELL